MMKKVLILGMAAVTLLCGCGNKSTDTTAINIQNEEFASEEAHFVHTFYPAVECILGEEVRHQEVKYDEEGFFINDRFISFEEIDEHVTECDGVDCV